jgi:hypothetical protein
MDISMRKKFFILLSIITVTSVKVVAMNGNVKVDRRPIVKFCTQHPQLKPEDALTAIPASKYGGSGIDPREGQLLYFKCLERAGTKENKNSESADVTFFLNFEESEPLEIQEMDGNEIISVLNPNFMKTRPTDVPNIIKALNIGPEEAKLKIHKKIGDFIAYFYNEAVKKNAPFKDVILTSCNPRDILHLVNYTFIDNKRLMQQTDKLRVVVETDSSRMLDNLGSRLKNEELVDTKFEF